VNVDRVLLDDAPRPYPLHQTVLLDHLSGHASEFAQDVEGAAVKLYRLSCTREQPPGQTEPKRPKRHLIADGVLVVR
jgi:hypothetical protein